MVAIISLVITLCIALSLLCPIPRTRKCAINCTTVRYKLQLPRIHRNYPEIYLCLYQNSRISEEYQRFICIYLVVDLSSTEPN